MKTILITGATSGIGLATANKFNNDGYRLILCGRRQERLEELKRNLKVPIHLLNFDVRNYRNLKSILDTLPKEFSEIDILINNAGLALGREAAYETSLEDWELMIDTNIKGLMGLTHIILPQMVKRNAGCIINVGSVAALNPYFGGNVYGATKSFVHHFSSNLRNDLLGTNVRVTIIAPGIVETELFKIRFKGDEKREKDVFEGIKALEARDVAEAIYWATQQPPHVNINMIEIMPICQAPGNVTPKINTSGE